MVALHLPIIKPSLQFSTMKLSAMPNYSALTSAFIAVCKKIVWILLLFQPGIGAATQAQETLKIAFDNASPMTTKAARKTPPFQIYPAVVGRAFEHMGVKVEFEAMPFNRILAELGNGELGAGAIIDSPDRREIADFSEPYFSERLMVYSRKDDKLVFHTLADFDGNVIGVLRGWSYGPAFDEARRRGRFQTQEVESDAQNFAKLDLGRVDYILAPWQSGQILLAQTKYASLMQQRQALAETPICLAFNKKAGRKPLLDKFNQTIRGMKASGEIDRLIRSGIAQTIADSAQ